MDSVRIDKWLWAARFFKTRGLAADACEIGRIEVNGQRAKASRAVKMGDRLRVTNEAGVFQIEVSVAGEVRGPAAVAQTFYRETEESRAERQRVAEDRKAMLQAGGVAEGRPTKQDRRKLKELRGRIHRF
ncbi:RNA-binding S4 domain-containing protein [Granulicella arctica]|uniref:Ribosome-associated heat shock protein Hsp15 n=1 Tax=Granulicella arctica TaxID=940613 RepID=A0A7Y9TV37_9BACT|nr:RNA-binding S4 domain-containing protein [Granulicella arctica]NYF81388.1 ribosome-associated heat shock protein Hsp15 [Granulicella arctica]